MDSLQEEYALEAHGVRFSVTHRGFDNYMPRLFSALAAVEEHMEKMGAAKLRSIHKEATQAEKDLEGAGVTMGVAALEKMAFTLANQEGPPIRDGYIWLHPA